MRKKEKRESTEKCERSANSVKITVLLENTSCRPDLTAEHGLSLYIETGGRRILFDMGKTDAFAENAEKLGIDLASVDTAILSHGHNDHGGGMETFLRCNTCAPLYVTPRAFEPHYNRFGSYIGLDAALQTSPRLVFTEEECSLGENLTLYSCNSRLRPFGTDTGGLQVEEQRLLLPEDFRHEQYLLVREGEKRILISGCSHKGICNLASWFQPDILVGGFHLKDKEAGDPAISQLGKTLGDFHTVYYTGHCTGTAQYDQLKGILGDRLQAFSTGTVLEL